MLSPQDEEFLKDMTNIYSGLMQPGSFGNDISNMLRIVAELKKEIHGYEIARTFTRMSLKTLEKERDGLREELNKEKLAHWNFHKDQADSFKNKS